MKKIGYAIVGFMSLLASSCQEELDFVTNNSTAHGSVSDSIGNCLSHSVEGIYHANSNLNSSNFLRASVSFSQAGTYTIYSDTVNGYYFRGSGVVSNTGIQQVTLAAFGRPLVVQTDTFALYFDSSRCEFSVEVINDSVSHAVFSFTSSSGACLGTVLSGAFTAGVDMTASNTATLSVSVTQAGPYELTTDTVNGVYFSGSGILTTASNSLVLTAHGTPTPSTSDSVVVYNISSGTSNCAFSITYSGVPLGNASFTFDCSTMNGVVGGGTHRLGVPLNPAIDTAGLMVNVTTPGNYSITSSPSSGGADGVTFNKTGTFTNTGLQRVTLGGQGVPTRPAIVFYNISSPQNTAANFCTTAAYYDFLQCSIDASFYRNFTFSSQVTNDSTSVPGYVLLHMKGYPAINANESLELIIGKPVDSSFNFIGSTEVYSANDWPNRYVKAIYRNNSNPQITFSAQTQPTPQTNPFLIRIDFCTDGRIEGTFTGELKENAGAGPASKTISGNFGLVR